MYNYIAYKLADDIMKINRLSLTAQTLYGELREMALAIGATEGLGDTPGSVVTKVNHGVQYLYFQYRDLGGVTRQSYLGRDTLEMREWVERFESRKADRQEDLQRLNELRGAFLAAGGQPMLHAPLRVLKGFSDAGILRPGIGYVLVGTHAFNALGNTLGVRWSSQMMTQDLDVAGESVLDIAITRPTQSAPDVLEHLGMGFIPVPTLNPRSPSTSFRVRGQDLRVDLLAPLIGQPRDYIFVPSLNAPTQPLRFLDYLITDPVPQIVLGKSVSILCNVPRPERFALHKLLVSESRDSSFSHKAEKDRHQAMQMLRILCEDSPDAVGEAYQDLQLRGNGWIDRVNKGLRKSESISGDTVELTLGIIKGVGKTPIQ